MDSWGEYRQSIDRKLDELRPDRALPTEREWREPVYGWARNHLPDESNVIRNYAKRIVDQREGQATKRGYRIIRRWAEGQSPLDWSLVGPLPIIVDEVRIRLDAATPDDVEDAARELEARGKATYDEIVLTANGLRDIARAARRSGHVSVAVLGTLVPGETRVETLFDEEDDGDAWDDDEI